MLLEVVEVVVEPLLREGRAGRVGVDEVEPELLELVVPELDVVEPVLGEVEVPEFDVLVLGRDGRAAEGRAGPDVLVLERAGGVGREDAAGRAGDNGWLVVVPTVVLPVVMPLLVEPVPVVSDPESGLVPVVVPELVVEPVSMVEPLVVPLPVVVSEPVGVVDSELAVGAVVVPMLVLSLSVAGVPEPAVVFSEPGVALSASEVVTGLLSVVSAGVVVVSEAGVVDDSLPEGTTLDVSDVSVPAVGSELVVVSSPVTVSAPIEDSEPVAGSAPVVVSESASGSALGVN